MSTLFRSVLGIELASDEIRVVEMTSTEDGWEADRAGSRPIPPEAIVDGIVVQTTTVAGVLRGLLQDLGTRTKEAVFSVPPEGITVRMLNLPPTAEADLAELVRGEVHHFQILRFEGAPFGHFPLRSTGYAAGVDPTVALLMGCETPVIQALSEVARLAALKVVRAEPGHLAILRAANATIGDQGSVMALICTDERSDILLIDEGNLCFYRRLDVGLSGVRSNLTTVGGGDFDSPTAGNLALSPQPLASPIAAHQAVAQIGVELQRSMEYFARENRSSEPIERLVVAGNRDNLFELASELGATLGLRSCAVDAPWNTSENKQTVLELASPSADKYTTAFGLCLGEFEEAHWTPLIDLYENERGIESESKSRARVATSLAASIAAILVGIGVAYGVGLKANHVDHLLFHMQEDAEGTSAALKGLDDKRDFIAKQTAALSTYDVLFNPTVDAVASSLAPGVGLTEVRLYPNGSVDVVGESLDEGASIETARRLQSQSQFDHVTLASFEKAVPGTNAPGVRFKLVCTSRRGAPATGGGQ